MPVRELTAQGSAFVLADPRYPERLRTITDPPPMLYCEGVVHPEDRQAIAIVGARQATPYGLQVTDRLARDLAGLGLTIISGMARGIDAAAHRGALAAGGRTIAVLGCGLDVLYPPEHGALRAEIAQAGAVLTEFPPGTPPRPTHFPRRNRLISGLALGVVVVEAGLESGSLITARLALEQGREVFAVPGPVGPMSQGPHRLLKQGAKLVESVTDILEELLPQLDVRAGRAGAVAGVGDEAPPASTPLRLSSEEEMVYAHVGPTPATIDDLTERTRLSASAVAGALLGLELKNVIRQLPGQRYYRFS